jgi:hypothetical protein
MIRQIVLAAALAALAGCAVPMQTVDASRAACASYGFQPGSDAFAECVMTEQQQQSMRRALLRAAEGDEFLQAPALPPLPQLSVSLPRTQFCFGSGAFEQCQ